MIRMKNLFAAVLCGIAVMAMPILADAKEEPKGMTNQSLELYNEKNGLPTGEANAVLQTEKGAVWIGSYGGLVQYDGKTFENYSTKKDGLGVSGIRALFENHRGELLIATNDEGVFCYSGKKFLEIRKEDGKKVPSARCFAEVKNRIIYVGTTNGLYRTNEEGEFELVPVKGIVSQTVYNLTVDKNDILWGTLGNGAVFALDGTHLLYYFRPGELAEEDNYCVFAKEERVYVGTSSNKMLEIRLKDDEYNRKSYEVLVYETGQIETINSIYVGENGKVWIASETGAGWFDESMQFYTNEELLECSSLNGVMEDYEGNVWLSSSRDGVYHVIEGKYYKPEENSRWEKLSVNAIAKLGDIFYLATEEGVFAADEYWREIENSLTRQMKEVRIRDIFADEKGNIWVSTYGDYGLVCYHPQTDSITFLSEEDGLLSDKVRKVIELKDHRLAVASASGVNIIEDGVITESYGKNNGMSNAFILCLLEGEDGTIYAGSDGDGIYAIKNGGVKHIGEGNGLDAGVVLRMTKDEDRNGIWISAGDKLYFMNEKEEVEKIESFYQGAGSIVDLFVKEDKLIVLKSDGVYILSAKELLTGKELEVESYGNSDGLSANINANTSNMLENGKLYLCTVKGISLLDSENIPKNQIPPKTDISEVWIQEDGKETQIYQGGDTIWIPENAKRLTIRYACYSYTKAPSQLEYSLEGFDEKKVETTSEKDNRISYTNLSGGTYKFVLSAKNKDGSGGTTETVLKVKKRLKLTERPVFWILCTVIGCILLIGVVYGSVRIRTRQIRIRQQRQKEITDQALLTIANTIDAKDPYTNGHSKRVAEYSKEIAKRLGMSEEEQENVYYTALLHDIGKIGIPDAILNKPGRLTEEEFDIMKNHTLIGKKILSSFTALPHVVEGALCHHERMDGKGYPNHIKAEEIPMVGKIICVADSYDAMATKRPYQGELSREYILGELERGKGVQFDEKIAQIMIEIIRGEK